MHIQLTCATLSTLSLISNLHHLWTATLALTLAMIASSLPPLEVGLEESMSMLK